MMEYYCDTKEESLDNIALHLGNQVPGPGIVTCLAMRITVRHWKKFGIRRIGLLIITFVSTITIFRMSITEMPKESLPVPKTLATSRRGNFVSKSIPITKRDPRPFCSGIFQNDAEVIEQAEEYMRRYTRDGITDEDYISMSRNCDTFISQRGYITKPLSAEEKDFPLAYSIVMYKDVEQAERLLRAVYMPQNFYCIHMDLSATLTVFRAMTAITDCLPNVFMSSKRTKVIWGTYSVLEADLNCMKDLLKYQGWRYFINLTGQEMPLLSNREIVRVLKALNGSNDIEGSIERRSIRRTKFKYSAIFGVVMASTFVKAPPPPGNLLLTKGSAHIVAVRGYVDYVCNNPEARAFARWLHDSWVPDETFFSTLNYNPKLNVPGSFNLSSFDKFPEDKPFVARYKKWGSRFFNLARSCQGKWHHDICIPGVRGLSRFPARKELFLNKMFLDFDFVAFDCMEEMHFNRTVASASPDFRFDDSFYKNLPQVRNHL